MLELIRLGHFLRADRYLMRSQYFYLLVFFLIQTTCFVFGLEAKPRVFVLTDINLVGGDPDDRQSLVHLLWYADELDIVAVVPDRWNGKGREACQLVIDVYEKDYEANDFGSKGYPSVGDIERKIARDEDDAIERLLKASGNPFDPLYVLVWGNMKTLKAALYQHPEIAAGIRVLSIATGLKYGPRDEVAGVFCNITNWNGAGRDEIFSDPRFKDMWWVESNWTYNGMFVQPGPTEMFHKLQAYGAMGAHIKDATVRHSWAQYFRVGDTPSVLYLIDASHDVDDPTRSSWAGKFKKPFPESRPHYYTDDNDDIDWDYTEPCNTWHNLKEMYAYNKSTLVAERQGMYDSLLKKLDALYD